MTENAALPFCANFSERQEFSTTRNKFQALTQHLERDENQHEEDQLVRKFNDLENALGDNEQPAEEQQTGDQNAEVDQHNGLH